MSHDQCGCGLVRDISAGLKIFEKSPLARFSAVRSILLRHVILLAKRTKLQGRMNLVPSSADALRGYLSCANESEADRLLGILMKDHAMPVVQRVLMGRAGTSGIRHMGEQWDLDEVASHAKERLLGRLLELRRAAGVGDIDDFERYVAVVAGNCWSEHLREKFPQRARLRNQLRYLVEERAASAGLTLIRGPEGSWAAGLERWGPKTPLGEVDLRPIAERLASMCSWPDIPLSEAVRTVLREAGGPLSLEQLVGILAALRGVSDQSESLDAEADSGEKRQVATPEDGPLKQIEWREHLVWLWERLMELSLRQRTAFLLHMDDVREFDLHGVATVPAIAGALEMDPVRFAHLWPEIPFDDHRIAALLGAARQQVINLRMVARDKIRRKLGEMLQA